MSLSEISLVKMKRCALKYRRNDSDGLGTWKEWKNIGYHVEYYTASSRERIEGIEEEEEDFNYNQLGE